MAAATAATCRPGSGCFDRRDSDMPRCRPVLDPRRNVNMDYHRSPESYSSFPCSERKSLITYKGNKSVDATV